jgi:two-component system response regulator MprA
VKILVVDDERAVRESLRRALELEGYEIELAEDGREALERLAREDQPDAVILDVLMPGVDGLEVCRTLRSQGSRLPVLMLTARTQVEDRVEGLDAGADDYLTKPFALAPATTARAATRSASPIWSSTRARVRSRAATSGSS